MYRTIFGHELNQGNRKSLRRLYSPQSKLDSRSLHSVASVWTTSFDFCIRNTSLLRHPHCFEYESKRGSHITSVEWSTWRFFEEFLLTLDHFMPKYESVYLCVLLALTFVSFNQYQAMALKLRTNSSISSAPRRACVSSKSVLTQT